MTSASSPSPPAHLPLPPSPSKRCLARAVCVVLGARFGHVCFPWQRAMNGYVHVYVCMCILHICICTCTCILHICTCTCTCILHIYVHVHVHVYGGFAARCGHVCFPWRPAMDRWHAHTWNGSKARVGERMRMCSSARTPRTRTHTHTRPHACARTCACICKCVDTSPDGVSREQRASAIMCPCAPPSTRCWPSSATGHETHSGMPSWPSATSQPPTAHARCSRRRGPRPSFASARRPILATRCSPRCPLPPRAPATCVAALPHVPEFASAPRLASLDHSVAPVPCGVYCLVLVGWAVVDGQRSDWLSGVCVCVACAHSTTSRAAAQLVNRTALTNLKRNGTQVFNIPPPAGV